MAETANSYPKRRRSVSAEAALRAEIQRVEKMMIEERMRAALSMEMRLPNPPRTPQKRVNDVGQDG